MSQEPRYARIGLFVVGAVCITVAAVVFFGRGRFFEDTRTYISFFSGSVKGLTIGAPVSFRGARVGKVKDVSIVYKQDRDELIIPVLIELDVDSVVGLKSKASVASMFGGPDLVTRLVDRGLRAQLALDSLVTGQLFVQLDFMPQVPVRRMATSDDDYPEIPTAPSPLEKLQETLQEIPLAELAKKTVSTISKIEDLLQSDQLSVTFQNLNALLTELKGVAANVDSKTATFATNIQSTTEKLSRTLDTLEVTVRQTQPLVTKTSGAVDEVTASARALRRLADFLEQHPESLLRGKR
jgi:paraquat-inducible protein B